MGVLSFLQRLGFGFGFGSHYTHERESAEVEDVLRDNTEAFQEVNEVRERAGQVNDRLARAVARAKNPFADLEDLTHLRRDIVRHRHDHGHDSGSVNVRVGR